MQETCLQWILQSSKTNQIQRYCPQCGRQTEFHDSGKRRNNANGKTIHCYAIYKCPKDHTWNLRVGNAYRCDASSVTHNGDSAAAVDDEALANLISIQEGPVDIQLTKVEGKYRLDRLLASRLDGINRSTIQNWIRQGHVLVDGKISKPSCVVRTGQRLRIEVNVLSQSSAGE